MTYLLFQGDTYYSAPAWHCYAGEFETREEATGQVKESYGGLVPEYVWWQLVDVETKQIVDGEGEAYAGLNGMIKANNDE